jgi:chaperonin cofactor prefoldin
VELVDIFKIVLPVIVALCGTVYATIRWTYERESAAQRAYWQVVHETLQKDIRDQGEHHNPRQTAIERQLGDLDEAFSNLRVKIAEEYVKRDDWLDQEKSVERKVDLLRADISKQLSDLTREVAAIPRGPK